MRIMTRIISIFLIICYIITVGNPAYDYASTSYITSTSDQTITTTRLFGQTRYETAKVIAENYKQGKVRNVIICEGNGFTDALSASVLAHKKEAPILLVDSSVDGFKDAYEYMVQHLDSTGTVYIIGGIGVISKEVETKLNLLGFKKLVRIAGNNKYDTSYQLANALTDTAVSTVVISSGESYPDALSISSFAANNGWPILLTPQDTLPEEVKKFLLEKKPSKVYITGGVGVISDNVKSQISNLLPKSNVERLAGLDRFDTNVIIAQTFKPNPSTIYLTTGCDFADALAGSVLAAKKGDPIIFINPLTPTLPKSIASYFGKLNACNISPIIIAFGSNEVVSDEILKNSSDLIIGTVEEDDIYYIEDITSNVFQNEAFALPASVQAKLYNSEISDVTVQWNPLTVDTSKVGLSVYDGVVDGYRKTIRLNLKIHLTNNKPIINAFNHIETPTYEGSGQAVHPSVIDFQTEYSFETWGGFRYWMALTPYPYFNSAFENPSILVSSDGLNWISPPGIKNPLFFQPGSLRNHYNSDPELVYDPDQNTLILYWRECRENAFERIWVVKISPDYKQSEKILCFEKAWDYQKSGLVLSPTIWRKNAKEWYMWTTDGRLSMQLYTSTDGITWSSGQPCSAPWDTWNGGYIPWHIAAKPNHPEKRIDFLISGWPIKGTIQDCQLLYATAPMSQPKELSMPLQEPLLRPGAGDTWDNGYIYRSSFVREPGDSTRFRIWYSACSKQKTWHIGYTEGTLTNRQ
ncbi:cell wall-binding repeat-containing protein [Desulfosporosinus sp. HMP52]|uniref:cell wall-binding repeat-containing protein n=1 Tax=Desulfosporosinus sp. HMP52 TaxID=1487923 RepID=UPI00068EBD91|nr:cell wall-binding repeat-containing protein [Desulfosporosinus sp. HMP52]